MIDITELNIFEEILYKEDFCYIKPQLFLFLKQHFSYDNLFGSETKERFENIFEEHNNHFAENVLLKKDLIKIQSNISKELLSFDDKFWIDKTDEIKNKITEYTGIDFKPKEINFVDQYPKGFENNEQKGSSCITIFEGNENAGIYFLNKKINRVSTPIHIIHEQIHTCLSQNKTENQTFIEWFEEGIVVFLSLKIYYDITKDISSLKAYRDRSYIYNKAMPQWDYTKQYFEFMKIAPHIFYQDNGDLLRSCIKEYTSDNRDFISDVLKKDLNFELHPKVNEDIDSFLISFSDVLEGEIVGPLEYLILQNIETPKTIEELMELCKAPKEIIEQAANSLFAKNLIIMNKEKKLDVLWRKLDMIKFNFIKASMPFLNSNTQS